MIEDFFLFIFQVFGRDFFGWFFTGANTTKTACAKHTLDVLIEAEIERVTDGESAYTVLYAADTAYGYRAVFSKRRTLFARLSNGKYLKLVANLQRQFCSSEPLSELRARRALFNKPKEYLAAFGESPDRKQLARLMAGVNE
jgi:hypothetical protein